MEPGDLPEAGTIEVDVGPVEVHLRRAPTWRRVAAWILDAVPFAALFVLALRALLDGLPHPAPLGAIGYADLALVEVAGLTGPLLAAVAILFLVYHALTHALAGATLGKRLMGLQVVGPDGRRPGLARSSVRALFVSVSVLALGLGILLVFFTRSSRSLHDLVARTWVVRAP